MLRSVKDLDGCELAARDGTIGHVREVYFDDHQWVVRHLVVDTGGWLSGRRVLIPPHAVRGAADGRQRVLDVDLTRQQVQDAPGIETDRPVSRQYEASAYDHYGYPYYWGGTSLWGMLDMPLGGSIAPYAVPDPAEAEAMRARARAEMESADPHLRSSSEVLGYNVLALDGEIGHVHDFLLDAQSWQISLVVVDTHNWLPDRLVLVPPSWVDHVDWAERRAAFKVTRASVEASPRYRPEEGLAAEEALRVQRHFEGMV